MLTTIAIVAAVLLASLLAFAATRPDTFRVERATRIQAPPEEVFGLIDDFRLWGAWSPYEKLDPGMKKTHSGAASGKGAIYEWSGNTKAGEGRMEITDVFPPYRMVINLDFLRPFKCHNFAEFTLEPERDSTSIKWALYGPQPYFAKVMTMFFSRDNLVGKDFEAGLAKLKAVFENTNQGSIVCN